MSPCPFGCICRGSALTCTQLPNIHYLSKSQIAIILENFDITSPKLYSVYADDLSDYLVKHQNGCHIDSLCVNRVMYANDIRLMAQIPAVLQKLIKICYDLSMQNNSLLNSSIFWVVYKSKLYKLSCSFLCMNSAKLEYNNTK